MRRPLFGSILIVFGLALLALGGVSGRGQESEASRSRVVLDRFAPPAVDRGVVLDESRAPDSPETQRRAAFGPADLARERAGASGTPYVAGKVIVKFRDSASTAARLSALSVASAAASARPSFADFDVLSIDAGQDAEEVARTLAARPDVEYAQAAYRFHTGMVPNDPLYPKQWNLPAMDLERAWDIQPQAGSSIVVAVLDTGMAYTNVSVQVRASAFRIGGVTYPALGLLTLPVVAAPELGPASRFVSPRDFIWDDTVPVDFDGHGTHVSGTIGQLTNNAAGTAGVAFNVKLMPVKVIDAIWDAIFGSPNEGTDDVVARGIRYAADNGAKVLNMSIGRFGPPSPVVEDAIKYAVSKGAFVVVAGGNDFETGNRKDVVAEIAGRVQGAVSVGAVDRANTRAYYSSTGSWIEVAAPGGSFRGFGAEGGVLQQTFDFSFLETYLLPPEQYRAPRFDVMAYVWATGTSMAAPHVSGLAAMLMQQGITAPAAVEAALERFATDRGSAGRDDEYGFGVVNARATLRGLGLAK